MATKSQRTMAAILALLFLLSSIATTAYVIWQINSEEPVATGQEETPLESDQPTASSQGTPLAGFTPLVQPVSAIQSTDSVVGTGAEATAASTVTVHYTLASASDGLIIESSLDSGEPLTRPLSELIAGWQQGVPGMKVGGKRRLIIPSNLAYNEGDLVFDIELLNVE